ncbi:MAG: hypothetical protein Q7S52_01885 [bacterium]|nr:hypothetical protein [bacterium]
MNFYKATKQDNGRKLSAGKNDTDQTGTTHAYAQINKEIEALMTEGDRIIFSPAEDFEYTTPLEDFRKSQQGR